MATYVLAVDIGTSNVKAGIFNTGGDLISLARIEIPIYYPEPGAGIQRLSEIYDSTLRACEQALKQAKIDVDALSFSAQMHGVSIVGKEREEITPLITYLDTRPASVLKNIELKIDSYKLYVETGCPPRFIYPLTKLVWLSQVMPNKFRSAEWFLSAKDYVMLKLLGEPYIDKSVAAGSQLLDIGKLKWSGLALEIAGINESKLPNLCDGEKILCEAPRNISSRLGLKNKVQIVLGASDGALHSVGVGAVKKGVLALNIGTSGAIRSVSEYPLVDRDRAMRFFCYYIGYGLRLPGGAVNNAGIGLRWFRDEFGHIETSIAKLTSKDPYNILTEEAEQVGPTSDNLIILPFLSGERFPMNNPYAKGVIFGLTLRHGKAHVIRALMEGCLYTLKWIYDSMAENGLEGLSIRTGGGGSRSPLWRQIQADIFNLPVEMLAVEEASLLGAAAMGFVALGVYKNINEAIDKMVKIVDVKYPNPKNHTKYAKTYNFYKKLYYTLESLYIEHSQLS